MKCSYCGNKLSKEGAVQKQDVISKTKVGHKLINNTKREFYHRNCLDKLEFEEGPLRMKRPGIIN